MSAPNRVLLFTEWTEFDAGAERAALALAQRLGAPLAVVVPLLSNPEFEAVAPEVAARAEARAAQAAADFASRAQSARVAIDVRVRRGDEPWREIVAEAQARQADLLVARRRGHRSFLGKARVGEVVRRVAAHAPCPVLMVPRAAPAPQRHALAVIDAAECTETIARAAAAFATALGLRLSFLVTAGERAQAAALLQRAMALAQAAAVAADGTVASGPAATIAPERIAALQADLQVVAMSAQDAAHGKLGGAVETLVAEVPCATLLVRGSAP